MYWKPSLSCRRPISDSAPSEYSSSLSPVSQLDGLLDEFRVLEDAQERAACLQLLRRLALSQQDGIGVAGPGEGELPGLEIQQAIAARDELVAREFLAGHSLVEVLHHLGGREDAVAVVDGLPHLEGLLDEDRQQGGRHRMADGIRYVEPDVLLVDAGDVVDVAGNPFGRQEGGGPAHRPGCSAGAPAGSPAAPGRPDATAP